MNIYLTIILLMLLEEVPELPGGGHRRFAKWEKKAYSSNVDRLGKQRWEEELRDYLDS